LGIKNKTRGAKKMNIFKLNALLSVVIKTKKIIKDIKKEKEEKKK
jgi:hypothetical protein